MPVLFLPKEATRRIPFGRIVGASLTAHAFAMGVFFMSLLVAGDCYGLEPGQGAMFLPILLLVGLIFSIPLTLVLAAICRQIGFFTFAASVLVGLALPLVFLAPLDFSGPEPLHGRWAVVEYAGPFAVAAAFSLPSSMVLYVIMRFAAPEVFATDWVNASRIRRALVYFPIVYAIGVFAVACNY